MSDSPTSPKGPADPAQQGGNSSRVMQGPGGFLPPSVSTSVTSAPFAFGGDDPAAKDGAQSAGANDSGSPFASGPMAYTTRPPWMVSEPAPGASLDSGPCFVQGHDTYTPFAPSEMPSTVGHTQAPFGHGGSTPPMGQSASPFGSTPPMPAGQTAAPFGTGAAAAGGGAQSGEDDKDAWYNQAPTYAGSRRKDRSVVLKLFVLLVKLMPAAMVLWGGYYGYQQFFGEMSEEELAAYYGSPGPGGAAGGGAAGANAAPGSVGAAGAAADGPKSRVGIMLQQAKDSISAHDQNVHMANAIADNVNDLDGIQASFDNLDAAAAAAKAPPPKPEAKVKLAFDDGTTAVATAAGPVAEGASGAAGQGPTNFTGPMSSVDRGEDRTPQTTASVAITAPELSTAEPSLEFRAWVSRVTVSGVRVGADPRAFVSGRLVRPGMVVDHRLGIHFTHVDGTQRLLYFEDSQGAVLGKRY